MHYTKCISNQEEKLKEIKIKTEYNYLGVNINAKGQIKLENQKI